MYIDITSKNTPTLSLSTIGTVTFLKLITTNNILQCFKSIKMHLHEHREKRVMVVLVVLCF